MKTVTSSKAWYALQTTVD